MQRATGKIPKMMPVHFPGNPAGCILTSRVNICQRSIPVVLSHLAGMLKKPNTLYLSFKYGDFEGQRKERYFTDLTEKSLMGVIEEANKVSSVKESGAYAIEKQFITEDVRPGRGTRWLNAFVHLI